MPQAIAVPAFPSIQAFEKPPEGEDTQYIAALAEKYLRKFDTMSEADATYGSYDKNGNFHIGNKPVVIIDNNIVVADEEYEGTPGLWELIVYKNPDDNIYTYEDYDNYAPFIPAPFIVITTRTAITPKTARGKNGKEYLKLLIGESMKEAGLWLFRATQMRC